MRGGSLKVLQELLGHTNITMTMRYAHLSPEHKKESVSLLDGLAGGGRKSSMSEIVRFSENKKAAEAANA